MKTIGKQLENHRKTIYDGDDDIDNDDNNNGK